MNLSVSLRWLPCAAVLVASSVFASPEQQLPEATDGVVAGSAATSAIAAMAGFSRYQTILDRMPFGALPPNFDPNAPVAASGSNARDRAEMENKLAAAVRLCMLNVTPAGLIAAGFTDSSVNPSVNYYLMVGQSQNGWTVVDADPASQSATLEKDGVTLVLALGAAPAAAGKSGSVAAPAVLHRSGLLGRPLAAAASATTVDNNGDDNSFVGKLRARRAAQQQEDAERKAREQADEQKRQEQMDALKLISDELRRERESRSASAAETAGGETGGVPDASADAAAAAARAEVDRANAAAAAARAEAAAAREAAAQAAAAATAQAESAAASSSSTKKEDEIPIMGWPATHKLKNSN